MSLLEIEPRFDRGDRVLVVARSGEKASLRHKGEYGAVLGSFPQDQGVGYEVLLDDEDLVELQESDLAPEI